MDYSYSEINEILESVTHQISFAKQKTQFLNERVNYLEEERNKKDEEICELLRKETLSQTNISHLENELQKTRLELEVVREELESMRKVSQIIHYEKENARLQLHIKNLEARLAEDKNQDDSDGSDIEVYEKIINNTLYYISKDKTKSIFHVHDDGSIGKRMGRLENVKGKLKPVWI